MSSVMLQSDLVAAVSHESQRDLRALRDANDKAPVDIARNMGADNTLIQVFPAYKHTCIVGLWVVDQHLL